MFIDENILIKLSGASKEYIHLQIANSYSCKVNNWILDDSVFIDCPLYIQVASISDKMIIENLYKKSKNIEKYFRDGRSVNANSSEAVDIPLLLKLKWSYESIINNSEIDEYIKQNSRSKEEATKIERINRLFNYVSILRSNKHYKLNKIFDLLVKLGLPGFGNVKYLYRKYKEFQLNDSSPSIFFSRGRNQRRIHQQKIQKIHVYKVNHLRRTVDSSKEITEKLKVYSEKLGIPVISRSTVKAILNDQFHKNRYDYLKKGEQYFRNNIGGYIETEKPHYKYQVIESDGSRLQIPYRKDNDNKWKVGYLTLYVIIDIATSKILGYSCDDFENTSMALSAFQNSITNTGYLPSHLRLDRSSANTSKRFKLFLEKAANSEFGLTFKYCRKPTEKPNVENFFLWFPEKICKTHPHYIGLSPLIKDLNKKVSPEMEARILHSKKLTTKEALLNEIPRLINKWNERAFESTGISPNEQEKKLKIDRAKFIKKHELAYLFWDKFEKEKLFKNTIKIVQQNQKFHYRLNDNQLILKLSVKFKFQFYWSWHYPEEIFLFDGPEYLGTAYRKEKYLDDPFNIEDTAVSRRNYESTSNNSLLREVKISLKRDLENLKREEVKLIPFNSNSGLITDKKGKNKVEEEFFSKYNNKPDIISNKIKIEITNSQPKLKVRRKHIDYDKIEINEPDRI